MTVQCSELVSLLLWCMYCQAHQKVGEVGPVWGGGGAGMFAGHFLKNPVRNSRIWPFHKFSEPTTGNSFAWISMYNLWPTMGDCTCVCVTKCLKSLLQCMHDR